MNDKTIGVDLPHLLLRESSPAISLATLEASVTRQPPLRGQPAPPGLRWAWDDTFDHPVVRDNDDPASAER